MARKLKIQVNKSDEIINVRFLGMLDIRGTGHTFRPDEFEALREYFKTEAMGKAGTRENSLHKHVVNGNALKKDIKKAIKKNCDGTHISYLYEWSLGTGIPELFDDICKKVDKHCR